MDSGRHARALAPPRCPSNVREPLPYLVVRSPVLRPLDPVQAPGAQGGAHVNPQQVKTQAHPPGHSLSSPLGQSPQSPQTRTRLPQKPLPSLAWVQQRQAPTGPQALC